MFDAISMFNHASDEQRIYWVVSESTRPSRIFTTRRHFDATSGCPLAITWTDGAPEHEARDTHAGVWWNGVGKSVKFTVPADAQGRVLKVYVAGIEGAGGYVVHVDGFGADDCEGEGVGEIFLEPLGEFESEAGQA